MQLKKTFYACRLAAQITFGATLAFAQATNPTQTNLPDSAASQFPVFRITAVSRSVKAINYHHRQGSTVIGFEGTNLAPGAKGEARVDSKTGATKIDVYFDKMPPPQNLGNEFLTYVLWAVTPEGRFQNLGEVYLNGNRAKLLATTELQAFGMIVTAEPYYAVTQPSDVVVLENIVISKASGSTTGTIGPIEAKYDLMQRGVYNTLLPAADRNLTKQDRSDSPLDLKEARFAMAIATTLGARQYAGDTMKKADVELSNAEAFWVSTKDKKKVQTLARVATQLAEDARLITVKRREEEELESERRVSENKVNSAQATAQSEAEQRRRADLESASARQGELQAKSTAANALAMAEAEKLQAEQARAEALRAKADADLARSSALESQRQLEVQRLAAIQERERLEAEQERARKLTADAEQQKIAAQKERERLEAEKLQLREELRRQFNLILETRDTARGLIVNMSDVLFDTGKFSLRAGAREKLSKIAGIVIAHPGLQLEVEGHTDSVGSEESNQLLSERRANAVRDYLIRQGLATGMITAKGMGEANPVTDNMNAQGRQQNRRVEMIVSGDLITRTVTITSSPAGTLSAPLPR